jgi:hypothetical protein
MALALPLLTHVADTARLVLIREEGAAAFLVALAMLVVRYGCTRRAFSSRRIGSTLVWLVAGVVVSGGLELGLWLRGLRGTIPDEAFEATARANFLAGPGIQVLYALVFLLIESRFVAESSHESADQAVIAAAVWLGVPWLPFGWVGASALLSRTSLSVHGGLALHLVTTVPVGLALVALARLILRRRWVAVVSSGRDARWRLVECEGVVPPGLPSLARTRPGAPGLILATVHPAEVPHRTAEWLEPRATL